MRKQGVCWLIALFAAVLLLTGCGPKQSQPPVTPPSQGDPAQPPAPPTPGKDQPVPITGPKFDDNVPESQVPAALRNWVLDQAENTEPAWKALTEGDATFIAATGGKRATGGWDVGLVKYRLPEPGGLPLFQLDLVIVPPRDGPKTGPLNPVHYFMITPQLGPAKVEVRFTVSN